MPQPPLTAHPAPTFWMDPCGATRATEAQRLCIGMQGQHWDFRSSELYGPPHPPTEAMPRDPEDLLTEEKSTFQGIPLSYKKAEHCKTKYKAAV